MDTTTKILEILALEKKNIWEIRETLASEKPISYPGVLAQIKKLEEEDYIEHRKGKRRAKFYSLTLHGLCELLARNDQLVLDNFDRVVKLYRELLPGIFYKWDYFKQEGVADFVKMFLRGVAHEGHEHAIYKGFYKLPFIPDLDRHADRLQIPPNEKKKIQKIAVSLAKAIVKDDQLFAMAQAVQTLEEVELSVMRAAVETTFWVIEKEREMAGLPKAKLPWGEEEMPADTLGNVASFIFKKQGKLQVARTHFEDPNNFLAKVAYSFVHARHQKLHGEEPPRTETK